MSMFDIPDDPVAMTPRDVSRWVSSLGGTATQFSSNFIKHNIGGFELINLNDDDLKKMGVRNTRIRKKILNATRDMTSAAHDFSTLDDDFDFVSALQRWNVSEYFFGDYLDVCALICEFSGCELPYPGSEYNLKEKKGSLSNFYRLGGEVGKGAFAVVYKCSPNNDKKKIYAAKIITKRKIQKSALDAVRKELDILKCCQHVNVMKYREHFETSERLTLILDYFSGRSLLERLLDVRVIPESTVRRYLKQMCNAIMFLHDRDICHRDVKLDNFLLSGIDENARVVLGDFGLAQLMRKDDALSHPCGTLGYTAPEICRCAYYTYKVDCWSLGVCLYILLCGAPPFESKDNTQNGLRNAIIDGEWSMEGRAWNDQSEEVKDLVCKLIEYSPEVRYSAEEAYDHPWMHQFSPSRSSVLRVPKAQRRCVKESLTSQFFNIATKDHLHISN